MKPFELLQDVTTGKFSKRKQKKIYSDTIYTFDIETTSLFNYDGRWDVFDYDLPPKYYSCIDRMAIPYIWMFGVEDTCYYGREFSDFTKVLETISDPIITKIIWVHNLSFEMGFLPSILKDYTIEDMCARDVRKPISFHIKELNIDFRCSYMLTNLSLEGASKEYTDMEKLKTLDYTALVRTPESNLTDDELRYCEYDILCLAKIIRYYKERYGGHVGKIPLTATSEVRQALREQVDYYYIRKQWDLVPSIDIFLRLMACFSGGYTHANCLNAGRIHTEVTSQDEASEYPSVMCLEKFPRTPFMYIDEYDFEDMRNDDNYCFIMKVKLYGVQSRFHNSYISYSRCEYVKEDNDFIYDNGRIRKCSVCELWITNIDLEIIEYNYKIDEIIFEEIYYSECDYLDIRVIQFILKLYGDKTKLKGVIGSEDIYKKSKAYINSLY